MNQMTLSYLVETDWAVHYLRGRQDIVRKLQELQPDGLAISVISIAELYAGVYRSANPALAEEKLKNFLAIVRILGVDIETCRIFGREERRLRREGQLIENFDLLIGATCLQHTLTLLTNNRQHFERIEGLKIISIP